MCTVSYVAEDWINRHPQFIPVVQPNTTITIYPDVPTREEFEALKKELKEIKLLLLAAKRYDRETGQPDCEDAEKVAIFKKLAKFAGVDMEKVFAK